MDPNVAVAEIILHLMDGEYQEARDAYDDLVSWLNSGGFPPRDPEWSNKVFKHVPSNWSYLSR